MLNLPLIEDYPYLLDFLSFREVKSFHSFPAVSASLFFIES